MARLWHRGLGLVVLLTITGSASAQFEKEFGKKGFGPKEFGKKAFGKKFDSGKDGTPESDRVRAEVKELQAQIDRLKEQIGDTTERLERLQTNVCALESARRPDGKGPPGRGPGPMPKGGFGKGGPGFKGPPFGGGGFGPQPQGGPGNPPGFNAPNQFAGGVVGPGGGRAAGFAPRNDDGRRGPSTDLEERVNRIERAVDELRREIRNRR